MHSDGLFCCRQRLGPTLRPFGTEPPALWNRAFGSIWNGLRPFGTEPLALSGTASGPLEQAAPRPLYCSLAGRDKSLYYLRPIILRNALRAFGTGRKALAALVLFIGRTG